MKLLRPGEPNKRGNAITARIVPVFLLGIIGYSSWVLTKLVCIDYLINPAPSLRVRSQTGSAIAILTIYYILLLMMLICFGRLFQTIITNPGLVPRGAQYYFEKERALQQERDPGTKEEGLEDGFVEGYTPRHLRRPRDDTGFKAEDFWHRDVFVCGFDGRPPFCSTCYNYKPDRAHHCRELGRCVLKMDHFCPWVGGIVSETSFKFFIQFTFWAALFCLNALVSMAYCFAKRRSEENFVNVHWILALIFAALFFLFTAGMCGSSLQFAFLNSTTIENFTRKTKIWYLAVYMAPRVLNRYHSSGRNDLRLITYPRPASEQFQLLETSGADVDEVEQNVARQEWDPHDAPSPPPTTYDPQSQPHFPPHPAAAPTFTPSGTTESPSNTSSTQTTPVNNGPASIDSRTFAILETAPGANPFDIGTFGNFKEVMGYTVFDWFLPLRYSPLVDHSDPTSMYKVGRVVEKLDRIVGNDDLGSEEYRQREKDPNSTGRHKRRRRRRRSTASANRPRSKGSVTNRKTDDR